MSTRFGLHVQFLFYHGVRIYTYVLYIMYLFRQSYEIVFIENNKKHNYLNLNVLSFVRLPPQNSNFI